MYNHVGNALNRLSGTVEGIGQQIGNNRVANAELGLKTAEQALRMPGMKLESQQAQDEIDKLNQPVNVKMFARTGDSNSVLHLLQKQNGRPPLYEALSKEFGATVDDKGNYLIDGAPMTVRELNKHSSQVGRIMGMYTDPRKAVESKQRMAQGMLDGTIQSGIPLDDKMKQHIAGAIEKMDAVTDADWLRGYEQQRADLEATKAPFIDSGGNVQWIDSAIKRAEGKISQYTNKISKAAEKTEAQRALGEKRAYAAKVKTSDRAYDAKVAKQLQKGKENLEKIKRKGGKPLTAAERKRQTAVAKEFLLGQAVNKGWLTKEDGQYSGNLTGEQANELTRAAQAQGFMMVSESDEIITEHFWSKDDVVPIERYIDLVQIPGGAQNGSTTQPPSSKKPNKYETNPEALAIRERFRKGEITWEEARAELKGKTPKRIVPAKDSDAGEGGGVETKAEKPTENIETFEEWAAKNPKEAAKSGGRLLWERLANMTEEEKKAVIKRKKARDKKTFLRKPPVTSDNTRKKRRNSGGATGDLETGLKFHKAPKPAISEDEKRRRVEDFLAKREASLFMQLKDEYPDMTDKEIEEMAKRI